MARDRSSMTGDRKPHASGYQFFQTVLQPRFLCADNEYSGISKAA
jgi:hypothetical protein